MLVVPVAFDAEDEGRVAGAVRPDELAAPLARELLVLLRGGGPHFRSGVPPAPPRRELFELVDHCFHGRVAGGWCVSCVSGRWGLCGVPFDQLPGKLAAMFGVGQLGVGLGLR